MLSIHLHNMVFFAHHGLYDEEKKTGTNFSVDINLKQKNQNEKIVSLNQTTDYAAVFSIVEKRMSNPTELLETLAEDIAHLILENFLLIDKVEISITKLNAPIKNFNGTVGISFVCERNKT